MPPKPPLQARAWGTRYDSLRISPPISPRAGKDEGRRSAQDKESPPLDGQPTKRKDDKLSHDASIFIGRFVQLLLVLFGRTRVIHIKFVDIASLLTETQRS
jgi:hypothetical protein